MVEQAVQNVITDADEVITVQDTIQLSEGINKGFISSCEINKTKKNDEEYKYFKVNIKTKDINGKEVEIHTDFPYYISKNSELGKFLEKAGIVFNVGQQFNFKTLSDSIGGKQVQFEIQKFDKFFEVNNESLMFVV